MRRVALLLLFATSLSAQTPDPASIRGSVADAIGAKVLGAAVTLENLTTGAHRATRTDARGAYVFAAVPVSGSYRIRIAHGGFADVMRGPFVLRAGETATFDAVLAPTDVSESMTVYA